MLLPKHIIATSHKTPYRRRALLLTYIDGVVWPRGLIARVESEHRIVRAITWLPGGKLLLLAH